MLGKASELRTKIVYAGYEYPNGITNIKDRRWVQLDERINSALAELGEVSVLRIDFKSQAFGDDEMNECALIIYKETETVSAWVCPECGDPFCIGECEEEST